MQEKERIVKKKGEQHFFILFVSIFFVLIIMFLAYQNIKLLTLASLTNINNASTTDYRLEFSSTNVSLEVSDNSTLEIITKKNCECDCVELNNKIVDSDNDGLSDRNEAEYGTDPENVDSDGDGYSDFQEIENGYNPLGDGKLLKKEPNKAVSFKIERHDLKATTSSTTVELDKNLVTISPFVKIKASVSNFFTGVGGFFKNKFSTSEITTNKNIQKFLNLNDVQYISFVLDSKKEQIEVMGLIKMAESSFRRKLTSLIGKELILTSNDFIWPVPKKVITSKFHDSNYPFKNVFEHPGIDIPATQGTPVKAINSGYVAMVVDGGKTGYSYVVMVHGSDITSVYGHLSKIAVKKGQRVSQGEIIGLSGGTPNTSGAGKLTTGPHLHLEIREKGEPVDPLKYLK